MVRLYLHHQRAEDQNLILLSLNHLPDWGKSIQLAHVGHHSDDWLSACQVCATTNADCDKQKEDKHFFHISDNEEVNVVLDRLLTCFKSLTFVRCLEFDFYWRYKEKIVLTAQQVQKLLLISSKMKSCNETHTLGFLLFYLVLVSELMLPVFVGADESIWFWSHGLSWA